jgi:hypothetical protein
MVEVKPSSPSAGAADRKVSGAGGGPAATARNIDLDRGGVVGAVRARVLAFHVRVGDDEQPVAEVVEDDQGVGQHEHGVG